MAHVEEILKGKYPAKEHARRVGEWITQNGGKKTGLIYLEAQKQKFIEVREPYDGPLCLFASNSIYIRSQCANRFTTGQ
jgi:hypothetical protein